MEYCTALLHAFKPIEYYNIILSNRRASHDIWGQHISTIGVLRNIMITAMKSESFSTRRYQYKDKRIRSGAAAALPNFCDYLIFETVSCSHARNTKIYGAAVNARACVCVNCIIKLTDRIERGSPCTHIIILNYEYIHFVGGTSYLHRDRNSRSVALREYNLPHAIPLCTSVWNNILL